MSFSSFVLVLVAELHVINLQTLGSSGLSLVQVEKNLVDVVWAAYDRPLPPSNGIFALDKSFTGKIKFSNI